MNIVKRINNIIINLNKGEVMKSSDILRYINNCRSLFGYFKVTMNNGYYIIVVYNKDNTVVVTSNYRNLQMFREIDNLMNVYTQDRVNKFIFRWINTINK